MFTYQMVARVCKTMVRALLREKMKELQVPSSEPYKQVSPVFPFPRILSACLLIVFINLVDITAVQLILIGIKAFGTFLDVNDRSIL